MSSNAQFANHRMPPVVAQYKISNTIKYPPGKCPQVRLGSNKDELISTCDIPVASKMILIMPWHVHYSWLRILSLHSICCKRHSVLTMQTLDNPTMDVHLAHDPTEAAWTLARSCT